MIRSTYVTRIALTEPTLGKDIDPLGMHSAIFKSKLLKNAIGSVSASIAHRNHLYIDVFLRQDMPKRLLHARFLIPSGNYNADARSVPQRLSKRRQSVNPSQAI